MYMKILFKNLFGILLTLFFVFSHEAVSAEISAGSSHSCVIIDKEAYCWGENTYGQLGSGSTDKSLIPVPVIGLGKNVTHIAVGDNHTCAVDDGTVYCWGGNEYTQLGVRQMILYDWEAWQWGDVPLDKSKLGKWFTQSTIPIKVQGIEGSVTHLTSGKNHTCVGNSKGDAYCWGDNRRYQVGSSQTNSNVFTPYRVRVYDLIDLSAGGEHTCAIFKRSDKENYPVCWGSNEQFQLAMKKNEYGRVLLRSLDVQEVDIRDSEYFDRIFSGGQNTCATYNNRKSDVNCWGLTNSIWVNVDSYYRTSQPDPEREAYYREDKSPLQVSVGGNHICVVWKGSVWCWGSNLNNQLGDYSGKSTGYPEEIRGFNLGQIEISAGANHSCTLINKKVVRCWGENSSGQLGNNSTNNSKVPGLVHFENVSIMLKDARKLTKKILHSQKVIDELVDKKIQAFAYKALFTVLEGISRQDMTIDVLQSLLGNEKEIDEVFDRIDKHYLNSSELAALGRVKDIVDILKFNKNNAKLERSKNDIIQDNLAVETLLRKDLTKFGTLDAYDGEVIRKSKLDKKMSEMKMLYKDYLIDKDFEMIKFYLINTI